MFVDSVLPSPSWPEPFRPQARTSRPSPAMARACAPPAAIALTPVSPATSSEAVDLRQDGEGLLKFTGRVVDGIYAGDDFTETSTAATTDPGQCEGRGISNEAGEGSIVLTHP